MLLPAQQDIEGIFEADKIRLCCCACDLHLFLCLEVEAFYCGAFFCASSTTPRETLLPRKAGKFFNFYIFSFC